MSGRSVTITRPGPGGGCYVRSMAGQGLGGRVAVAASCALLGVCLAGGPLYVSSAASESVQLQLASTCPADVAVHLPATSDPAVVSALAAAQSSLRQVEPAIVTQSVPTTYRLADSPAVARRLVLVHRDGQEAEFDPPLAELREGEVLVPDYLLATGEIAIGTDLAVDQPPSFRQSDDGSVEPLPERGPVSLLVVGTYPAIPVRPEPSFWCGWREQLRPTSRGDLPPPVVLTAPATLARFGAMVGDWEARPSTADMTRDDAWAFQRRQDAAVGAFATSLGADPEQFRQQYTSLTSMRTVAERAETVADLVGRTMAPVRLAGVAVSAFVLAASAVMVARERRRELRLIAIRGGGPATSMARLLRSMALPSIAGSALGLGFAVIGVKALGPTPELEVGPFRTAFVATVIGAVAALLAVSLLAAVAGDREVDARPARRRWRRAPIELVVPALALAAFLRLDRVGGVRLVGARAQGGDLLAQSFPLLALATPVALLVRPLRWLVRRMRRVGGRLPDALRLGVRRALAEPLMTALILLASAFAAGCVVLSSTLLVSAQRQLVDKATTFIGSDEAVRLIDPIDLPAALTDRSTVVGRLDGYVDGANVDILAVDPDTFLRAVYWRDDPVLADLPDLLEQLADPDAAAVVVVGSAADRDVPDTVGLVGRDRDTTLQAHVIARLDHFPGFSNGSPMIVIARSALDAASLGRTGTYVWIRDPPADAVQLLRDAGARITNDGQRVDDVFDVISFRAVRWSYSALGAFGVFVAAVVLMMQLLTIDARRQRRQAAHVMMSRMGFGRRRLSVASAVEVAIPLIAGVALGVLLGVVVAHASVRRLDTLRQLRPPAVVVVDVSTIVVVAVGSVLAVAALALLTVVSTIRARPLEVMRGTA